MKTLKLLTITALVGTFSMSILHAENGPQDRVNDKRPASQHQNMDIKKSPKVKDDKKVRVEVKRDDKKRPHTTKETRDSIAKGKASHADKKPHTKKHAVKTLKRGDRGPKVKALQRALKKQKLYRGTVDGIFGKGVKRAVKKFQRKHKLYADGIAGAKTLRALHL